MPASNKPPRTGRKGHYSCDFCRARKLRCSRPLPCINCVSRGKKCVLEADGGHPVHTKSTRVAALTHTRAAEAHQQQLPPPARSDHDLLDEVQRLRRLAEDLERRIAHGGGSGRDAEAESYNPTSTNPPPPLPTVTPATTISPDDFGPICAAVTHLDRLSMGKGSYAAPVSLSASSSSSSPSSTAGTTSALSHNGGLVFKTERILAIPTAPEYMYSIVDGDRLGPPLRYVYLPVYTETVVLLDTFLLTVSYVYRIVHHPTVQSTVRALYDCVQRRDPAITVPLGDVLLLLSIVATGTYLYSPPQNDNDDSDDDDDDNVHSSGGDGTHERPLFSSRDEAMRQTTMWIQTGLNVLDAIVRGAAPPTLSAVQGAITLSFLICNFEGIAFKYRHIISTGLLLGRELGLHCIDHEASQPTAAWNPLEREIGRRVWWYLVSTDWLLAARSIGPGAGVYQSHPQMMCVNEPCNINDAQLSADGGEPVGLPRSQPTDMSYFLERLRLAKIARGIVDRTPMASRTSSSCGTTTGTGTRGAALLSEYRRNAAASDAELEQMLRELPRFSRLDTYEEEDAKEAQWKRGGQDEVDHGVGRSSTFVQAYMIHSLIYTQRCKLHLSYLTSWRRQQQPVSSNAAYSRPSSTLSSSSSPSSPSPLSRIICIEAARKMIRAEAQLRRRASHHPFVMRRLSCVLYSVFLASIVLLVDLCSANHQDGNVDADADQYDNHQGDDDNAQRADAFQALRILADASGYSPAAAELYASLTQLMAKHRPQLLEEAMLPPATVAAAKAAAAATTTTATETVTFATPAGTQLGYVSEPLTFVPFGDISYADPLPLNFEGLEDLVNFQWDDLLSGVDSSMFL